MEIIYTTNVEKLKLLKYSEISVFAGQIDVQLKHGFISIHL
jgi:hypothetical protein